MRQLWSIIIALAVCGCGEVLKLQPDAGGGDDAGDDANNDPCTGVCECRVDADCAAPHTGCDDQVTSRTCACVAGYEKSLEGACEFTGVVADPGFESASVWSAGAAVVDPNLNEAGMADPGAARFAAPAACALARVTQTVTMPKLSRAEPMVAQMSYRFRDPQFSDEIAPAFGIGVGWQDQLPSQRDTFKTARFCLGAAQYAPEDTAGLGAEVELALMPARPPFDCNPANGLELQFDRFEVVPANPDECPPPGTPVNGDLESTGGWTLLGSSANGNPFSTTIEPGIGEGNSKAIRLFARNRCSNLSASNPVSIPSSDQVASPAISFFNKTTASATDIQTRALFGSISLPGIPATGTAITQRVCVPAFMRGGVFTFSARLDVSGACADTPNPESIVDSLEIVNEPSCGTDPFIADPGFESTLDLLGTQAIAGRSIARAINDPSLAHTGDGALQLSVTQLCSSPSWQANVIVPPSGGGGGPALTFFYRATPKANYQFAVNAGTASFTPVLDDQYHAGKVCLDPKLVGRNQIVRFAMGGGGGTCAITHPAETAFVDDLATTTDPDCPAN